MKSVIAYALAGAGLVSQAIAGSDMTYNIAKESLDHIKFLTENLTQAIYAFDAHPAGGASEAYVTALEDIHYPSVGIAEYVMNATEVLKNYPTTFDLTQSFLIASPTQRLAYAVNISVAALNVRNTDFRNLSLQSIVIADLTNLTYASQNFSQVLISYVPTDLQPVAQALDTQIIDSLDQGVSCFNPLEDSLEYIYANCPSEIPNVNRTFDLAVQYGAILPDGSPIA